jgi:uncharacterized membrane protein (UPF0127 family)
LSCRHEAAPDGFPLRAHFSGVYRVSALRYVSAMLLVLRRAFLALLLAVLAGLLPRVVAAAEISDLVIVTAAGPHAFKIEVAATEAEKAQGLMFRRELAPDAGMLFDMGPGEHEATFWMKNTYIPLDMLFIRADGRIQNIAARTVPRSLDTVPSDGPVKAVLEVNGGTAARLGIKPGDIVRYRLFGNSN